MQSETSDDMESKGDTVRNGEILVESKPHCSEIISSDRESSIESFHTNKSELSNSTTAETELIDVDDIELSDEESWLYKSPKKLTSEDKALSTYKWLHDDVKDMDDLELRLTKNALVSKLNQLKMISPGFQSRVVKDVDLSKRETCNNERAMCSSRKSSLPNSDSCLPCAKTVNIATPVEGYTTQKMGFEKNKENDDLDLLDVHKIARLQEESLRQSSTRFLSQTERKGSRERIYSPVVHIQGGGLSKPASVEALNTCSDKISPVSSYSSSPMQDIKKQSLFGSYASLSQNQDLHRGSLPNINRGYCTLRPKTSKHPSDKKMACPLPIYPSNTKPAVNGTVSQNPTYDSRSRLTSPLGDYRESRTLPSSYRVHSRSNSAYGRDSSALSPSPRRESTPFLSTSKNSPVLDINRRESVPCNGRKFLSPVSSPTLYQRCSSSSPVFQHPTKPYNNTSQNLRSPPTMEHHRNPSHSPSRRLPLTTVHNHSPKRGNSPGSPRNGEFRALKFPSKIPSPASRSGIPVPSQYSSRANEDDSWSQDCF